MCFLKKNTLFWKFSNDFLTILKSVKDFCNEQINLYTGEIGERIMYFQNPLMQLLCILKLNMCALKT